MLDCYFKYNFMSLDYNQINYTLFHWITIKAENKENIFFYPMKCPCILQTRTVQLL